MERVFVNLERKNSPCLCYVYNGNELKRESMTESNMDNNASTRAATNVVKTMLSANVILYLPYYMPPNMCH